MMFMPVRSKLQQSLFAALTIGSLVATTGIGATHADGPVNTTGSPVAMPSQPAVGTDLHALDTASEHYSSVSTQAGPATRVQIYNAPVGLPTIAGWDFSDPTLQSAADNLSLDFARR